MNHYDENGNVEGHLQELNIDTQQTQISFGLPSPIKPRKLGVIVNN